MDSVETLRLVLTSGVFQHHNTVAFLYDFVFESELCELAKKDCGAGGRLHYVGHYHMRIVTNLKKTIVTRLMI